MEFNKYPEISILTKGLAEFDIELADYQLQQFMDYYELLVEKNKVMNLTTITEPKDIINKHFIDSVSLARVLKLSDQKIIDLGTGAGFPGIPLKIVFPMLDLVLLDSIKKRLGFLDEVIQILGLKKIRTLHGRAEDYGKDDKYREQFDICVSRAVAKLSILSEYCLPYVKKEGYFISYKSGKVEEEMALSEHAIKILGARIDKTDEFILPSTDIERTLIAIKKISQTPKVYPRNAGKPVKDPL